MCPEITRIGLSYLMIASLKADLALEHPTVSFWSSVLALNYPILLESEARRGAATRLEGEKQSWREEHAILLDISCNASDALDCQLRR